MKIIYAEDITPFDNMGSDAGAGFDAKCPDCKAVIQVSEHQWWDSICECGLKWKLSIIATAEKEEEGDDTAE